MYKKIAILFILIILISCNKEIIDDSNPVPQDSQFITAVDISRYPEISKTNPIFYDTEGNQKDFLTILKENGVNTIRLRLWVNPANEHSGFNEVKQFAQTLKNYGFAIWLTLHYSDTWADPGKQNTPTQWQNFDFPALKNIVYNYTKKVVSEIQPSYIQIGNEINTGFLHPYGNITSNYQQFIDLMHQGVKAVRENANDCKIILHFAGIENANWFYNKVKSIDYDIIGLSYYPIWHGKSLATLKTTMQDLSNSYNKKVVIAETAYPFTLQWNDWTTNIVGLNSQLILPTYPATTEGQRMFIKEIKNIAKGVKNGIGFCYWGAELIAWKGNQSKNASPWENQALFNFNNKALPALSEFKNE